MPSIAGPGKAGTRFPRSATFPRWRRIPSLPQRWEIASPSIASPRFWNDHRILKTVMIDHSESVDHKCRLLASVCLRSGLYACASACVVASLCVATCCTLRRLNQVDSNKWQPKSISSRTIVDSSWSHAHNGGCLNELNNILNSFMFGFQCCVVVFSVQPFK